VRESGREGEMGGIRGDAACFCNVARGVEASETCFRGWAEFISAVVEGKDDKIPSGGKWVQAKTGKESPVDLATLTELGDEEVWRMMREERDRRQKVFEQARARARKGSDGEMQTARL